MEKNKMLFKSFLIEEVVTHQLLLADHRDLSDETAKELKKILKKLGLFVYDLPMTKGSDTHGIVFSKKPMTTKEIKDYYQE